MPYMTWSITDLAQCIHRMQDNKFDCIVAVTGRRGLGKSTLAVKLALRWKNFHIRRDVCFARDAVLHDLAKKKKGVILADEMINVSYNRDFYSEEQKKLIKMLNMYRDHGNLFIACVPTFYDLDRQFRELVKIRIDVMKRGMAIIHTQNQSSYSTDRWDSKLNEKIEKSWAARGIVKPKYKKLTTYRGVLIFKDLTTKQRDTYEQTKEEKRHHLHMAGDDDDDGKLKIRPNYKILFERLRDKILTDNDLERLCVGNDWLPDTIRQGLTQYCKKNYGKTFAQLMKELEPPKLKVKSGRWL